MIIAILALLVQQPTVASFLRPPAGSVKSRAVAEGDQIECRDEKPTGSHLIARYCLTRDDWSSLHDKSMQNLYGFHQSNAHVPRNAEGTQFLGKE